MIGAIFGCLIAVSGCGTEHPADAARLSYDVPITTLADRPWEPVPVPTLGPDEEPDDTLFLQRQLADTLLIGQVTALEITGGYVVVGDQFVSPHIALVELESGDLLRHFGRDGPGPREFRAPMAFAPVPGTEPRVWVYDFVNVRLTLLALGAPPGELIRDQITLHVGTQLIQPVWLDGRWLSNGLLLDHTFIVLDSAGEPVRRIRGHPVDPTPFGVYSVPPPPLTKLKLSFSRLAATPSGDRLALAYQYESRIDYYTPEGVRFRSVRGPREVTPYFRWDEGRWRLVPRRGGERAYVAVDATERYVYALFCGDCSDDPWPSRLHVFDWQGHFICELALSTPVTTFAVSENDSVLVAQYFDDNFVPRLGEWMLPARLRNRMDRPKDKPAGGGSTCGDTGPRPRHTTTQLP